MDNLVTLATFGTQYTGQRLTSQIHNTKIKKISNSDPSKTGCELKFSRRL